MPMGRLFKQHESHLLPAPFSANLTRVQNCTKDELVSSGRAMASEPGSVSLFSASLYTPLANSSLNGAAQGNNDQFAYRGDPLDPVQPIGLHHNNWAQPTTLRNNWHRSKSQLGDQFQDDHSCGSGRRPLSANIDRYSFTGNAYFPSHQRHRSSTRYSQPRSTGTFAGVMNHNDVKDDDTSAMVSEYKSSFREPRDIRQRHHSLAPTSSRAHDTARATSPLLSLTALTGTRPGSGDDSDRLDDDHELSAYRPSRYVPRVAPAAKPSTRSVSLMRDHHFSGSRFREKSPAQRADYQTSKSLRRRSVQTPLVQAENSHRADCDSAEESSEWPVRRRNWTTSEPSNINATSGPNSNSSRLSELEQRLQANKRRREELLQGINSVEKLPEQLTRTSGESPMNSGHCNAVAADRDGQDQEEDQLDQSCGFERPSRPAGREAKPQQKPATRESYSASIEPVSELSKTPLSGSNTRHRASRLESMEARIRRKSYCVRVRSPKRTVT